MSYIHTSGRMLWVTCAGLIALFVASPVTGTQNGAPVISMDTAPRVVDEDTPSLFHIDVTDPDAFDHPIQVMLNCFNASLTLYSTTGLTFIVGSGGPAPTIVATATMVDWQHAMYSVTYLPSPDYNGVDLLEVEANDLGWTGDGGPQSDRVEVPITINAVNDPPLLSHVPPQLTAISGHPLTVAPLAEVSDPDVLSSVPVQCTVSALHGGLSLGSSTGLIFTVGDGNTDATMTFRGTYAAVNAGLSQVVYASDMGYIGEDTITVTVDDLGYSGAGGALQDTESIPVNVISSTAAVLTTWGGIKRLFEPGP
jgi:hypothetical protein